MAKVNIEELNTISEQHNSDMVDMGWIDHSKGIYHYLMLAVCEVAECVQAHRKKDIIDEHIDEVDNDSEDAVFMASFEEQCKDTVSDEMADTLLRLLSYGAMCGYRLNQRCFAYKTNVREASFTEWCYNVSNDILAADNETRWNLAVRRVLLWTDTFDVNIIRACRRKMRYNRLRQDWKNHEKRY